MAGTNDGGPAFPSPGKDFTVPGGPVDGEFSAPGMTLRDYFAGQALAGILGAEHDNREYGVAGYSDIAEQSYSLADAMIAARSK